MTEHQLTLLMEWIDARIDQKIEQAFDRDALHEYINEGSRRRDLVASFSELSYNLSTTT